MKRNKGNYVILALALFIIALGIGYASFATKLTIDGTAKGTTSWDVKFTSAKILNSAGIEIQDHGTAEIAPGAADKVTANINLKYPGDGVILEVVVTNNGQIPAKLSEFTITGLESDPDVEVVQGTNALAVTEVLQPTQSCTAQFAVKWKTDSVATTLGENKKFTVTYNYTQNTEEVILNPTHSDSVV